MAKLDQLPGSGKVVIAHPNREADVRRLAKSEGCDYMLRRIVPDEPRVYVLDMDALTNVEFDTGVRLTGTMTLGYRWADL